MNRDPLVMANLGGVLTDDETRKGLNKNLEHWDRNGYGVWMFREQASSKTVGRAGLRNIEVAGKLEIELLYALRHEYWGEGRATEMAAAIVQIGFTKLEMQNVVAFTLPTNQDSRRVMEKVGFIFEGEIEHAGMPHVLYRLNSNAVEWAADSSGGLASKY